MSAPIPCRPHPDSKVCMIQGDHLTGCTLTSCTGCVACPHHNPQLDAVADTPKDGQS